MTIERTLVIIKPDAVRKGLEDSILGMLIRQGNFKVIASDAVKLKFDEVVGFYGAEHSGRPYYEHLVDFMLSGTVVLFVLEGENAIARTREIMGSTKEPAEGTIRKLYSESVMHNCIHGSDSPASAEREISFFFDKI